MFKAFLLNTAFDFVKEYLLSDENMEALREEFKDMVFDMVQDSENDWDNEAAEALFKFMKFEQK